MLVVTNLVACIWFLIGCFDGCNDGAWASVHLHSNDTNSVVANMPAGAQYLTSIYWASATMASVGYGDIHANNTREMAFAIFVMLLGVAMYGYFIASITASIANADFERSRYREKHDCLQSMLATHSVEEDVATRVADHFEYSWIRNRGSVAHSLFKDLPLSLQADLCMDVYEESILKVPLFQNTGVGFVRLLSLVMRPSLHLKGDFVVRKVSKYHVSSY